MKRAGEMSNEFLGSEADKAFRAMIEHMPTNKSLNILLTQSKNKSPPIRAKVALYLSELVAHAGTSIFQHKDYERLIQVTQINTIFKNLFYFLFLFLFCV